MKRIAYLGLGGNLGDKVDALRRARNALLRLPDTHEAARSAIYRTPPWGVTEQDWFANAVLAVETGLEPEALLDSALAIEAAMGRERRERWGPRVIDIDLLFVGQERRVGPRLILPHPAIAERAFVLVPLMEIAPPGFALDGKTLGEHLARLERRGIEPYARFESDPAGERDRQATPGSG